MRTTRQSTCTALLAILLLAGCGASFSSGDAAPEDAGSDAGTVVDPGSVDPPAQRDAGVSPPGESSDAADDGATASIDAGPCASPATEPGIYVSKAGADGAACGTRESPCATVQVGIDRAAASAVFVVNVDRGTYTESVTLKSGVTVRGGFTRDASGWRSSCADSVPVIQAPASATKTLAAVGLTTPAHVEHLALRSKAAASPGESLYGAFVTGGSDVTFDDVVITVAAGGSGANGAAATPGTTPATCGAASTGAVGTAGANGAAGTVVFTSTGVSTTDGTPGVAGTAGQNGTAPATQPTCVEGAVCIFVDGGMCSTACIKGQNQLSGGPSIVAPPCPVSCGTDGTYGCGGTGGGGGGRGQSGGSSIGIFVYDAHVKVVAGKVTASDGGAGGRGLAGAGGGAGSLAQAGKAGDPLAVNCRGAALRNPIVSAPIPTHCVSDSAPGGLAGSAGGNGGTGGIGGAGGGGAGGSSYAIYAGGKATVDASGTELAHGVAGKGGAGGAATNGGADGAAGNRN